MAVGRREAVAADAVALAADAALLAAVAVAAAALVTVEDVEDAVGPVAAEGAPEAAWLAETR